MAKPPSKGKETISPPKKRMLSDQSAALRKGSSAAGRILSEEAQAVKQGVRKPGKRS
jgi:hypothetical protein